VQKRREEFKDFATPDKKSRVGENINSPDLPGLGDNTNKPYSKSVTFAKYLDHEDLIMEVFDKIKKSHKFNDSYLFNKTETTMNLMPQNQHFDSAMKIMLSTERFSRGTIRLNLDTKYDESPKKTKNSKHPLIKNLGHDREFQDLIRPKKKSTFSDGFSTVRQSIK
jgi:hypothetical protein